MLVSRNGDRPVAKASKRVIAAAILDEVERLLGRTETTRTSFSRRGAKRLANGMSAQATVPLEKAKRLEPEKASIREALGIAYFRLRRWQEAEAEFRAVLELSPTDDYAHYALGRALEKQGRQAEANGHYKLASSMEPTSRRYAERVRELSEPLSAAKSPPEEVPFATLHTPHFGKSEMGARRPFFMNETGLTKKPGLIKRTSS